MQTPIVHTRGAISVKGATDVRAVLGMFRRMATRAAMHAEASRVMEASLFQGRKHRAKLGNEWPWVKEPMPVAGSIESRV